MNAAAHAAAGAGAATAMMVPLTQHHSVCAPHPHRQSSLAYCLQRILHLKPACVPNNSPQHMAPSLSDQAALFRNPPSQMSIWRKDGDGSVIARHGLVVPALVPHVVPARSAVQRLGVRPSMYGLLVSFCTLQRYDQQQLKGSSAARTAYKCLGVGCPAAFPSSEQQECMQSQACRKACRS